MILECFRASNKKTLTTNEIILDLCENKNIKPIVKGYNNSELFFGLRKTKSSYEVNKTIGGYSLSDYDVIKRIKNSTNEVYMPLNSMHNVGIIEGESEWNEERIFKTNVKNKGVMLNNFKEEDDIIGDIS